jgi:hypothetical protein
MNLEEFLTDIKPEATLFEEVEQDTEKFIKNIEKVRLNMALKNADRIENFMKQLGSPVRGVVKSTILRGAVSAFTNSRAEVSTLITNLNDQINQYADKTSTLLDHALNQAEAKEKIDKNVPKFENIFDMMTQMILEKYDAFDEGLIKRNTIGINTDRLENKEEVRYAELSDKIIEYYVRELLKIRAVLSAFQTFVARVKKRTQYPDVVHEKFPPIIRGFVATKFGERTGRYLVAHVDKYYSSTNDRKEEFRKFENLLNKLLGVG